MIMIAVPSFAWFYVQRNLAAYAPIFSPEANYIGAGHLEPTTDHFEDIRYMYFDTKEAEVGGGGEYSYWDKVFCIYGKRVS